MRTDLAFSSFSLFFFVSWTDIIGYLSSSCNFFSTLRCTITFTNRVEKPRHRSLEMYSRRHNLQRCITDRYESTSRIVMRTPKRGQIDLNDRSREKIPSVRESSASSYFDKDHLKHHLQCEFCLGISKYQLRKITEDLTRENRIERMSKNLIFKKNIVHVYKINKTE